MSRIPQGLTTRVARLEAQREPPAGQRGFHLVSGEDLAAIAEGAGSQEQAEADTRPVIRVLYGSAQPESLI